VRNRPPGGGGLYDIGCYAVLTARYLFGAEPVRVVATLDRDADFGTDRLVSALIEFPGGRHLTFTVATQLSAHQRVTIVGQTGRIEIVIPFNALPDAPMRIVVDSGADLVGGGARVEAFAVCDQYGLQGDAFSRAVLGEAPFEFGIEDAVLNMRVIDALFRSAGRNGWETP
jgi:predicted dehydrogenase